MIEQEAQRQRIVEALERLLSRMREGDPYVWWELTDGTNGDLVGRMSRETVLLYTLFGETAEYLEVYMDSRTWQALKGRATSEGVSEDVVADRIILAAADEAKAAGDGLGWLKRATFEDVEDAVCALPLNASASKFLLDVNESPLNPPSGADSVFRVLVETER